MGEVEYTTSFCCLPASRSFPTHQDREVPGLKSGQKHERKFPHQKTREQEETLPRGRNPIKE